MFAAFRSFFAAVIDCWSSVFAALARTSPGVTASPTFALTSATCHVPVGVDPPLDELDELAAAAPIVGALPKARLQLVEAAIEPVAATSSETSATLAGAVRYVVAAAVLRGRTPVPTSQCGSADDQEHDDRDDLELHEWRLPSGLAPRGRGATPGGWTRPVRSR